LDKYNWSRSLASVGLFYQYYIFRFHEVQISAGWGSTQNTKDENNTISNEDSAIFSPLPRYLFSLSKIRLNYGEIVSQKLPPLISIFSESPIVLDTDIKVPHKQGTKCLENFINLFDKLYVFKLP